MPVSECLILFTRFPEPGTTKTRLIPRLGRRGAADLQRQMTAHAMAVALPLRASRSLELEVRFEGGSTRSMQDWLGNTARFDRQGPGDIGRRMARAFRRAFDRGHTSVILVGSDIPGISTALLEQAFERINDRSVVLGPAADGGYYLIGFSRAGFQRAGEDLFDNMVWGTASVRSETCRRLAQRGLTVDLLVQLADVDRPEDLSVWERHWQG